MKKGIKIFIVLASAIFAIIVLFVSASVWFNVTWFSQLGYSQIFGTIVWSRVGLGAGFFILFFLFAGFNLRAVFRSGGMEKMQIPRPDNPVEFNRKTAAVISIILVVLLSFIMANYGSKQWDNVLKFFNGTSFGITDPLFQRDISFYVFIFPVFLFLRSWSLLTIILTLVSVGIFYFMAGHIKWENKKLRIGNRARNHILFLMFLVAIVLAWSFWLARFNLLFSTRGLIDGAVYTSAKVVRPSYYILIAASLVTAVLMIIGIAKKSLKQMLIGGGILLGSVVLFLGIVPGLVQLIAVGPNEIRKETPYIEANIQYTREGYDLNNVIKQVYPVEDTLTADDFGRETDITEHIRLWDQRPLKATFSQVQAFRIYYDFNSVNVDRYHFGNDYRQVMISAREINTNNLPQSAKTWINEKLQYTHGYGVVMAPVNKIGQEGLPELFIQDVPPKFTVPLTLDRPEIYYGQTTYSYVFGNTKIPEFDYPKGNQNVTAHYGGTGGIDIKNGWRKFLLALHLKSTNILFTNYFTPESKAMVNRSIDQRVRTLARFLRFDSSPYIVVSEGKLYWMLDAYTTTGMYPYSTRSLQGYNYIRNSVKITIDAYNGDVNFYVVDSTDPIIETYRKIFPDVFKDFSEMPKGLAAHVRYPRDLFQIQSEMYTIYHMTDPVVFYNKEDEWVIPTEIYDQEPLPMKPYYAIIDFDDAPYQEEYVLMLPFSPSTKNNMLSWMAAMCDPDNYGKIIEYQFPKEKLIFGPMQIESRIDQNTEISQLFTLWGQKGSKVIRGNLLVYPIKNSLLYVEPIYLQAEQSELPELKQVVVAYQNRIGVGVDLREALNKIFGRAKTGVTSAEQDTDFETMDAVADPDLQELIDKAVDEFNGAQERLRNGDFGGYGEYINRLEQTLNVLQNQRVSTE